MTKLTRTGLRAALLSTSLGAFACATAGSAWMEEPLIQSDDGWEGERPISGAPSAQPPAAAKASSERGDHTPVNRTVLGGEPRKPGDPVTKEQLAGRVLGSFRNTYYDFPTEAEYEGSLVPLMNGQCRTIKMVPKGFHDAVCVQGSGTLRSGQTVSFHKRDCACAEICPRTNQKICFDALDPAEFPWGRGATGRGIQPLLTIATDPEVIPMGTAVYIPELDGMPIDHRSSGRHDGCFIALDKGLKVKGKHVDIFTGTEAMTELWNQLSPSNKGVTVVLDSPRCERVTEKAVREGLTPPPDADDDKSEKKKRKKKKR